MYFSGTKGRLPPSYIYNLKIFNTLVAFTCHRYYYRLKNHPRSSSSSSHHHQKQQTNPNNTGILLAQNPPPLPDDYPMNEEEGAEESTSTPLSHQQDDYARNLYCRYLHQWEEKNRDGEQQLQRHTTSSTYGDEFFYQQLDEADDYFPVQVILYGMETCTLSLTCWEDPRRRIHPQTLNLVNYIELLFWVVALHRTDDSQSTSLGCLLGLWKRS